nr:hypothetical protein [Tanacetum cinerariifolium]
IFGLNYLAASAILLGCGVHTREWILSQLERPVAYGDIWVKNGVKRKNKKRTSQLERPVAYGDICRIDGSNITRRLLDFYRTKLQRSIGLLKESKEVIGEVANGIVLTNN